MLHEDVQIVMPHRPESQGGVENRDCIVMFDGVWPGHKVPVGFWYGAAKQLWKAAAVWYGSKATTNNVAEDYALLDALEWLTTVDVDRSLMVLVLGDS